jgi:SAM-dependent methyltransferase
LSSAGDALQCIGTCGRAFPIIDGVPVLIDPTRNIFDGIGGHGSGSASRLARFVPSISRNIRSRENYRDLAARLSPLANPLVLVVGGQVLGDGIDELFKQPGLEIVESDVAMGERSTLLCDAHQLPFDDETVDCVVAQAVLEHVLDPNVCVAEIHRVLKRDGVVYAETPFLQHVHLGRYDFTRFTHLGHRRLFRWFEEIASGATCGPAMALAWSWSGFLTSFARGRLLRGVLVALARLTSFWLLWFDRFLVSTPGGLDNASAVFFMGRKAAEPLPDEALLAQYAGAG